MSRFDVTEEDLDRLAERLEAWPANGRPETDDVTIALKLYGLIVEGETKTPCPACGTPRVTYHYLTITPAGRLFLRARQEKQA